MTTGRRMTAGLSGWRVEDGGRRPIDERGHGPDRLQEQAQNVDWATVDATWRRAGELAQEPAERSTAAGSTTTSPT